MNNNIKFRSLLEKIFQNINIPSYLGDDRNPKFYVDISQKQIDQKQYEASEELREKKIPENLEPGNTFNYEVDWTALVGSKYDSY